MTFFLDEAPPPPLWEALRASGEFEAALERAAAKAPSLLSGGLESGTVPDFSGELEGIRDGDATPGGGLKAIILFDLRSVWFVFEDAILAQSDFEDMAAYRQAEQNLTRTALSVGRVDLRHHRSLDYAGTGWLIEEDLVVTNRHVAEVFARPDLPGRWRMGYGQGGRPFSAALDTMHQHRTPATRPAMDVTEIVYVAGPREPDIAFMRVAKTGVAPLELDLDLPREGDNVAAIGYPAEDSGRNDPVVMRRLFGGIYGVKRVSPGRIIGVSESGALIYPDYSTLGGNSGSPVVSMKTGDVVGLHFAGQFGETNYAVAARYVDAARQALDRVVPGTWLPELPDHAERVPTEDFADRDGYQEAFLGAGDLAVPLPGLGRWESEGALAPVEGAEDAVLRYRHFSVVQCAPRQLPLLTACNIDGAQARALKRIDRWRTDGRIAPEHQVDHILYKANPLDRGHMVRRTDPGWGATEAEAQQGELDTFFYTNCAPQHLALNRRDWVGLEDYILGSAVTRGFRACVLTGPVFRDTDRRLKDQDGADDIQIPESFWKIAAMINDETGTLSVTAYLLIQGDLIADLVETAFVLGAYETYQVQVARISALTGLDFSALEAADPLATCLETSFGEAVLPLAGREPRLS